MPGLGNWKFHSINEWCLVLVEGTQWKRRRWIWRFAGIDPEIFFFHITFSSSLPSPFCWSGRLHHEHFLRLDNLTAGYFIQTFSFLMIWGTVLIILDKPSWEAASLNSWMVMIDHQVDCDHQNAALRWWLMIKLIGMIRMLLYSDQDDHLLVSEESWWWWCWEVGKLIVMVEIDDNVDDVDIDGDQPDYLLGGQKGK